MRSVTSRYKSIFIVGFVVTGSRTWQCTIAAPALAASIALSAISAGVTGTAGFFSGVGAEPVTAQEIIVGCIGLPFISAYRHVCT